MQVECFGSPRSTVDTFYRADLPQEYRLRKLNERISFVQVIFKLGLGNMHIEYNMWHSSCFLGFLQVTQRPTSCTNYFYHCLGEWGISVIILNFTLQSDDKICNKLGIFDNVSTPFTHAPINLHYTYSLPLLLVLLKIQSLFQIVPSLG